MVEGKKRITRIIIFQSSDGQWRWHMVSGNNRIMATSGESFYSYANARRAAIKVRKHLANVPTPIITKKP